MTRQRAPLRRLLGALERWSGECVALRPVPKDHDGRPEEASPDRNIPVRVYGATRMMTREEYEAYRRDWDTGPPCAPPGARCLMRTRPRRAVARPSPGDISVCLYCGTRLRFAAGLLLVAMTDAQVAALPAECREFLTRLEIARQRTMADARIKSP